jgi:hypothetical protein
MLAEAWVYPNKGRGQVKHSHEDWIGVRRRRIGEDVPVEVEGEAGHDLDLVLPEAFGMAYKKQCSRC